MISKNLIVHVTAGNPGTLRQRLDHLGDFKRYYDGFECTINAGEVQSTRYYYYSIPHTTLLPMLRHLHSQGTGHEYKIKILEGDIGQYNFD